ncbi:MAG: hypothetical protein GWN18_01460, partial [Thermoplasmata archaeon]|nr:hypothetical protein [Thermoplasmata archaeon]NIS10672.1 hypothetical protein [Thermoplasmata archaeon]NIS18623.1 hypothetical protein [Thermoplasmata archaeon]NIT78541.1 hypothetical protein [Thermoplasmata archaeon]NIU47776.1 hypothetical protein [Thermoplasmata archaeon]
KVKAHPTVRVSAVVSGLGPGGTFSLDDLWLNWTDRMVRPPQVRGIELGESQLYRGSGTSIQVNVFDEYDLTSELTVVLEHRLNGTTDMWSSSMMGPLE